MAKKETFTQEKANSVIEAAALAAYLKFGFNPTVILSFSATEAKDIYISPKLPGADWYFFKDPVAEEAFIFNAKTCELLLVESEDTWSEKIQKKLSKISKADLKLWKELTGDELILAESSPRVGSKARLKAKPKAKSKARAKKKPAKKAKKK